MSDVLIISQQSTFSYLRTLFLKTLFRLIPHNYSILQVVKSQTSKQMFSLSSGVFSSFLGILDCMRINNESTLGS